MRTQVVTYTDEGQLQVALQEHAAACVDRTVHPGDVRLGFEEQRAWLETPDFQDEVSGTRLRAQLCKRLDPELSVRLFWERLSPYLRREIAQELLARAKDPWLLRLKNGRLRAMLSDQYRPLDHQLVCGHLVNALCSYEDTAAFKLYLGELVDDGAELRVLFDIFDFEFDPGDRRIPREWRARVELRNNEVGEGAVRVALYLAPGDRPDGLRFAERAVVAHRHTKHINQRFAEAIQFAASELQGMIVHLQEFAAMNVKYPEAVLAALRRRWELPEYLGEAILRAFQDMPGRTGAHLIWALLEAPKHLPADRAIPYELQLQLYDIAAWLATKAGREWIDQLPPPVKQVQLSFLRIA